MVELIRPPTPTRRQLSEIAGDDVDLLRALEALFETTNTDIPTAIDENTEVIVGHVDDTDNPHDTSYDNLELREPQDGKVYGRNTNTWEAAVSEEELAAHVDDTDNPHDTSYDNLELREPEDGKVYGRNSNAWEAAASEQDLADHEADVDNPHDTSVVNLIDTTITNPTNEQSLVFDIGTNKWINAEARYAFSEANPTGLIDGGEVNIGPGPNDVEIIAGFGIVVDSYTDPDARPVNVLLDWPQINELITAAPATAGSIVFLTIFNTGVPSTPINNNPVFVGALRQYATYPSPSIIRDELFLGVTLHDGTNWNDVSFPKVINNTAESLYDIMNVVIGPMFVIEGGAVTEAPSYTLNQETGVIWQLNRNWQNDHKNPHREAIPQITGIQWRYTNRDFTTVSALTDTIDDMMWDNDGTVEAMPAIPNNSTIQRLYQDIDSNYWMLWGQRIYDNAQEAASRLQSPIVIPALLETSFLLGYPVTEQGKSDWDVDEAFFIAGSGAGTGAGSIPITNHNDLLLRDSLVAHTQYTQWLDEWAPGTYDLNQMVRDGAYLMNANKTTTDRPAPQPQGSAFFVYQGNSPTDTITAKSLLIGADYTAVTDFTLLRYRVYTIAGNNYSVFYQINGGQVIQLVVFTAINTGWQIFDISDVIFSIGSVLTLAVYVSEPDPTPVTFTLSYDYLLPNNTGIPFAGEIIHSSREAESFRVNKTDQNGDQSASLGNIVVGDIIDGAGLRWSIQVITDNGTWIDFTISPALQGFPAGIQDFIFETVVSTPIETVVDVNYFLSNSDVQPFFAIDGGGVVFSDDAYGVDIEIQQVTASPDWDLMAISGSGGGGSPFVPETFEGADTTGYVPDPITESGRSLRDDGTWILPANETDFAAHLADLANPHSSSYLNIDDREPADGKVYGRNTNAWEAAASETDLTATDLVVSDHLADTANPHSSSYLNIDDREPQDGKVYGRNTNAWEAAASESDLDLKLNLTGGTLTGDLDVTGALDCGVINVNGNANIDGNLICKRIDEVNEGGELQLELASDGTTGWFIDVFQDDLRIRNNQTNAPDGNLLFTAGGSTRLSVFSGGAVTVGGNFTCGALSCGIFTSTGIDDNASKEMFQLSNDLIVWGDDDAANSLTVRRSINDGDITISGGSGATSGGNIKFFGGTHSGAANDILLRQGPTIILHYDHSVPHWNFQALDIVTTGVITAGNEIKSLGTSPHLTLNESDGTSTHNISRLVQSGDTFIIQTRDSSDAFVTTDYAIDKDSSGPTEHRWTIGGVTELTFNSSGLTVVNALSCGAITATGNITVDASTPRINLVPVEGNSAFISMGEGRTADGFSYVDLIGDSSFSDYGLRLIRNNTGANTNSELLHRGTGDLRLSTLEAGDIAFHTNGVLRVTILSTGAMILTSTLDMSSSQIVGVADGTNALNAVNKQQMDAADALKLDLTGGTLTGDLDLGTNAIVNTTGVDISGSSPVINLQPTGTGTAKIEIGLDRTLDGNAFVDLIGDTTFTDYGLRLIRNNTGANTNSELIHRGTGDLRIVTQDAGAINFRTSSTDRGGIASNGAWSMTGDLTITKSAPALNLTPTAGSSAFAKIGENRTQNGFSYVDFIGDTGFPVYGLRLIRNNTGSNATSELLHRGTGALRLVAEDVAPIEFSTNATERGGVAADGAWSTNGNTLEAGDVTGSRFITTIITIQDDAVGTIPAQVDGGFVFILAGRAGGFPNVNNAGVLGYDTGGSLLLSTIALGPSMDNLGTTTLTGTTGTDGRTSIAVSAGNIHIENRAGGFFEYTVTFVG